mmetsp:Transcript_16881/g.28601  ORF Transcript_16881/g.28601 Transcript_16881/m.28601 type:complete len:137 (+) Transcript_16881:62-472(+)
MNFVAGALGGLIGSAIANPADLLKIRMQAQPVGENHSIRWHISDVYRHSGSIAGFYKGVQPTMLRAMLLNATNLGTYDTIKHEIIRREILEDGLYCRYISSVFAGFFMALSTSPVDNIKTRVMNQRMCPRDSVPLG